jgi:GNAT superfamily N-acetyltransferase
MTAHMVRNATPADYPALLGLMRGLAEFEGYASQFRVTEATLWRHAGDRDAPDFRALVIDGDGGALRGMLIYYLVPFAFRARPTFYIKELFVAESARSEGVGAALLHEAVRRAHAAGCAIVRWQVARWNDGARRFYERHGATADDEWIDYQLDEAAMEQLLRTAV